MTLEDTVLDILGMAALPLKAADITKQAKLKIGKQAAPKLVTAALASLTAAGVVKLIAMGSKPPLHTTRGLEEAGAAMLRHLVLGAKKELEAGKLKAKLPAALQAHFDASLEQLVADGEAFVLAGKKRLVYAQRPKPSALLTTSQRGALRKIFGTLNGAQLSDNTLEDFVAWLDGEQADGKAASALAVPDGALLREWYDLDRSRSSTVMIPIPQTYAHYAGWAQKRGSQPDSQVLRGVMEELYHEGRILLEPCERPQDLPEHERAMLVPMSLGPPGWSWCWSE